MVQAGTLSTRGRGELNSFNVLRIARPELTIERYTWETGGQSFDRSYRRNVQTHAQRLDGMTVAGKLETGI